MAIKTVTIGSGSVDYDAGWKQLTIKEAKYGTYNSSTYMDIWFEDYPENLNARVYAAVNKTTKEEFRVSSWFRFANAGIQEVIDNGSGKPLITYDDDVANLEGVEINVLFYKDGDYSRIWREAAPVATDEAEEKLLPYTEDDVSYWKTRAERSLAQKEAMSGESESSVEAISNSIDPLPEKAPF